MDFVPHTLGPASATDEKLAGWLGANLTRIPKDAVPVDPGWARIGFGETLEEDVSVDFSATDLVKWQRETVTPYQPTLQTMNGRLTSFWAIDLVHELCPSAAERAAHFGELKERVSDTSESGVLTVSERWRLNPEEWIYASTTTHEGRTFLSTLMIHHVEFVSHVASQMGWTLLE